MTKGIIASIIRDRARARGLPLKLVDPNGCTPTAGITDHRRLECGNSHHDVDAAGGTSSTPNLPLDVIMRQVVEGNTAAASSSSSSLPRSLTAGERRAATTLITERTIARRHGGWGKVDPSHLRRASSAKAALGRANSRLHAAGLTTAGRRERHATIHELI